MAVPTDWIVVARGGGAGSAAAFAIPLVTGVRAGEPAPFLDQNTLKVSIPLHFEAPADLGTAPNMFTGYEVVAETPRGVFSCGRYPFTSTPGSTVNLSVVVDYPNISSTHWIYVVSTSDDGANPLVLHDRPDPTPYVAVDVAPFTAAPDVRAADAGKRLADGTFQRVMFWDVNRTYQLIDTVVAAPANTANFTAYQIWVRTPLMFHPVTDAFRLEDFIDNSNPLYYPKLYYFTMAFEFRVVLVNPESWDIVFVSLDHDGKLNRDENGVPTGPTTTLQTLSRVDYIESFTAQVVDGYTDGGDQTYQLKGSWVNPENQRYKGQRFLQRGWDDDVPLFDALENETSFVKGPKPKPPEPKNIQIFALPIYGDGTIGEIVPGETPYVDLTIARTTGPTGREYAPAVENFSVTLPNPAHIINPDGQRVLAVNSSWSNPTNINFGGAALWVIWHDGVHRQIPSPHWETTDYLPTAFDVVFYVLSQDTNNRWNTYVASGPNATPSVTIRIPAPQLGPLGAEYAGMVSSFVGSAANPVTSDGTTPIVITFTFTAPGKPWADIELMEKEGSNVRSRGTYASSPFRLTVPTLGSLTSYTYYAVSRDVNGRANTLVIGLTPSTTVSVGAAAGTFDATKFKPTTYDSNIFTYTNGKFTVYAVDGSLIVTGSISSPQLNATELLIGGGGGKPGKIRVFNAVGTQIAFIGVDNANEGIWSKTGGLGGTDASVAPVKADVNGLVTFTNGKIEMSGAGGQNITMDPTASYSLIRAYDATSEAHMVPGRVTVQSAGVNNSYPFTSIGRNASRTWVEGYASPFSSDSHFFLEANALSSKSEFYVGVPSTARYIHADIPNSGGTPYLDINGLEIHIDGSVGKSGTFDPATITSVTVVKGIITDWS